MVRVTIYVTHRYVPMYVRPSIITLCAYIEEYRHVPAHTESHYMRDESESYYYYLLCTADNARHDMN